MRTRMTAHSIGLCVLGLLLGQSVARGACDVPDAPDCSCFSNTRTWNPSGDILTVAELTAYSPPNHATNGVTQSCAADLGNPDGVGGKPFWQMQQGYTNSTAALVDIAEDPSYWGAANREEWCSETVSFWHRQAEIPYTSGYESWHWGSWKVANTHHLELWYQTEVAAHEWADDLELLGGDYAPRGVWLDDGNIDFSGGDPVPGVDLPCPGSVVKWSDYTYVDDVADADYLELYGIEEGWHWYGVHSAVVYEMWIQQDSQGDVCDVVINTVDGNINGGTTEVRGYDGSSLSSPTDFAFSTYLSGMATAPTSGLRRIDGFGIDMVYDDVGEEWVPSCDDAMIHWVSHTPCTELTVAIDYEDEMDPIPSPWYDFYVERMTELARWKGDNLSWTTEDFVADPLLSDPRTLPGYLFNDGHALFTYEWPMEFPFPVDEFSILFNKTDLTSLIVKAYSDTGTLIATTTNVTSLDQPRVRVFFGTAITPKSVQFDIVRPTATPIQVLDVGWQVASDFDDAGIQ